MLSLVYSLIQYSISHVCAFWPVRILKIIALVLTMDVANSTKLMHELMIFKRVEVIMDNCVKDFEDLKIIPEIANNICI